MLQRKNTPSKGHLTRNFVDLLPTTKICLAMYNPLYDSVLLLHFTDQGNLLQRGYWGDIISSPYLAFGIETEEASLMKKANDVYTKVGSLL